MTPESKATPFLELEIGEQFFYRGHFWTKTSYDAASQVHGSSATTGTEKDFVEEGESMMVQRIGFSGPA